jgi:hypothetical protein
MDGPAVGGLAVLILFGGPIAAWIVHRVFAHAEYMAMIRNGMTPPDTRSMRRAARQGWSSPPPGSPFAAPPNAGATWNAPSAPPPPAAVPPNAYGEYAGYYAQRQLHRGMVTAFVGLAILIGLTMGLGRGPWMLGGLIPMFVGLAQIITAVLSGATFGVASIGGPANGGFGQQAGPGVFGQAQQQPRQAAPPPTPDAYGAWRPGSMPSIEKPASPPDQR